MRRRIINKRTYLVKLILVLVMLVSAKKNFAAEEPYVNSIRGTGVVAGASFYVTDEKFLNSTIFYGSIRPAPYSLTPENIVELKLNYDTSLFFYDKIFTAKVNVTILCYNNAYDTSQVFTQYTTDLTIKHDSTTANPYKGVYSMKFTGAYKFRVIINSITCPELGTGMPPVLIVEGKTVIKRKYTFSPTSSDVTKIQELTGGQVKLTWVPAAYPGAELYDLEYTVVDDSSIAGAAIRNYLATSTPIPASFQDNVFRNNASRITTSASEYTFNPMYQAGYLLFRIRGVQFDNEYQTGLEPAELNLRSTGSWNYLAAKLTQPSYQYNLVQLQWHEPNLNWQYTITFAEEGKRKEVISYFDGIFKNRQNVTLDNSNKKTIVQESIYDALGRVGVNVLPAPTNDSVIHYFPNFNQNKLGRGYSYKDFAFGANCRTIPDTMSRVSGAHQYYSANNTINDYFFKKYIPQAEGYPFNVVEYTPDNTGRVFAQSGVGKDFQPGTNHETKFFYSKPTQEELDRLFGSEAGNASHYLKNMTVDPNGLINVNYFNASGKTVATALAGLTPNNVEALTSNNGTGVDMTKMLLTPSDFARDFTANTIIGNASFSAVVSGVYKFNYNYTPLRLDVLHGSSNQFKICNTCYYDLLITVKDNCNQVLQTVSRPVDPNTVFQTDCNVTPAPIVDSFAVTINNIGDYNVFYQLRVSEKAWAFYDSVHLVQNTNIRSFNSFALEKLNKADFKGCFSDCATCMKELGTKTDFINNKIKPLFIQADSMAYTTEFDAWAGQLYDSLLANCASIQSSCTPSSPCDEEKELLLDDVRPGGQYSLFNSDGSPIEQITNIAYNYRTSVTFYNEDGSLAMIDVDGTLYPANSPWVPMKLFIDNFQDSWAEALLPYHPEYCFYQWCLYGTNSQSKAFDNEITDMDSDSLAAVKGYFTSSYTALLTSDPFFGVSGSGNAFYSQMYDSLTLFSRTIPGFSGVDMNIKQYVDYELYCEQAGVQPNTCTVPAANAPCRSPYLEWQLYRDYYLNLKAFFNEKARLANPTFANCRNCYIGTDYTNILTCTPPPVGDFSIQLDPTYTSGKRIIVKYKNAEAAAPHNLKLTIVYQTSPGVFNPVVKQFRAGRGTEMYIVPVSVGDYYGMSIVECDTSTSGGGGSRQVQSRGGVQDIKQPINLDTGGFGSAMNQVNTGNVNAVNSAAPLVGCPCPDASMFSVFLTGFSCPGGCEFVVYYNGSVIPPNRTVYVDVYWQNMNNLTSGVSTVWFTGSQTSVYGCTSFSAVKSSTNAAKPGVHKILQIGGKPKQPTPEVLEKAKAFRDSIAASRAGDDQSKPIPPEDCNDFLAIQNVYCYDAPGFVCPGQNTNPPSVCADDPLYPYYKDKIRRYPGYENPYALYQNMINNYSTYQSQSLSEFNNNCQANCEAMADVWINSLRKCTTDDNLLATIKAGLIAVCQGGCDYSHPFGSSTNSSLTQSFESVIRQYIPSSSDSCTAELISDPYPYNKQPQYEDQTWILIDNCLVTKYNQLKTQYQNSSYPGTFHEWLQKQLKNDYILTAQQLADLDAAIIGGCKYLKRPLLLPVAFNCSSTAACVDSAITVQTYAAFLAKYPGITAANPNYEILLTNYFNHTLGFSLNFEDYNIYIQKCQTGTTNKDLLCNRAVGNDLVVKEDVMKCMSEVFNLAIAQAINEYNVYIDSVRTAFRNAYMGKCMNVQPQMTMKAKLYEYHYTLYYYDQGGNLVKTIPPQGVDILSDALVAQVQANRTNTNNYCYNNQPELLFNANIMTMNREYSYDTYVDRYSLEAWVKLGNLNVAGPNGIFSYNDYTTAPNESGFALMQRNSKLAFVVGMTPKLQVETPLLSTFLTAGTWFHIVINVDNNNLLKPVRIFINGNNVPLTYLNNNSPYYFVSSSYNHKLRLGASFDNGILTAFTNSGLKQFRWYQRELSTAEIQQNSSDICFTPASTSALISYVPVNEGTGSVLEDKVNYNVSTLSGNGSTVWQNYVAGYYPHHQYPTIYQYNSYNQVMLQNSPDAGTATFYYDILGRSVATQNSEQKIPKNTANLSAGRFAYTKYDAIGRTIEVGEKYSGGTLTFDDVAGQYDPKNDGSLNSWYNTGTDKQVTMTIYDQPNTTLVTFTEITGLQNINMRKRVAATVYKELKSNSYYDYATHYVYDINGNVKTLFQDIKPMRDVELIIGQGIRGVRQIDYSYDLISGKVNKVIYQKGKGDQFIYKYDYDADNRLVDVNTSRNGLQWQHDAKYYYYLHGPIARTELGKYQVQGVDYAYTLQGWIKGINSQALDVNKDMAGDGNSASPTFKNFGRDIYGYSVGYHGNDYKPIGGSTANAFDFAFTAPAVPVGVTNNTGSQLYNGNISNTTVALNKFNNGQTTGYSYLYDQLGRLLTTRQHSISGTAWNYSSYNSGYEERVNYDANGNIKTYLRKGADGTLPPDMDNLKYFYYYNTTGNTRAEYDPTQLLPGNVKTLTNELAHVDDAVAYGNYPTDIDDQNAGNYDYDNVGNLIRDDSDKITSVDWTVYGKVRQIVKSTGITINYGYDAAGNRVVKEVIGGPDVYNRQFYIRDPKGNVLAIYKDQSDYVDWTEQHLYGSTRLGVWNYGKYTPGIPGSVVYDSIMVGSTNYELTNHLGNVLSTISDKKIGVSTGGSVVDYYNAIVLTQNDYYPAGMMQPGRKYIAGSNSYRYSINGQEKELELNENITSAMYWEYDSRIARRWNIDPKQNIYESPYLCFKGNPVFYADPNGDISGGDGGKKLYHATNNAEVISKKGFDGELKGRYSRYNWFTTTPSNTNPSDVSAYGNTTIEVEANVSGAKIIPTAQTDAYKLEALKEMGYTTTSYNRLAKTNPTQWEKVKGELWSKVYGKVGEFMNKDGGSAYFLEKDGTYALSDNFANSAKVTGFSGEGAAALVKKLEVPGLSSEATAALKEWNQAAKMLKWGSRTIAVLAVLGAGYEIYMAENKYKEVTKQVAGFAAGTYCAGVAATAGVETGPFDILIGIGGFAFGYFVGTKTTEIVWYWIFERGVKVK